MGGILANEIKSHKYTVINVVGVSMQPLLYQGTTQVVVKQSVGELFPNDIVLYRRGKDEQVLHRVIRVGESCYYIRGDNCIGMEKIPKADVFAVVTKIYRKGRYIEMDDPAYLRYVAFWNTSFPLRLFCFRLRGIAGSIKRRMEKIWSKIKRQSNS